MFFLITTESRHGLTVIPFLVILFCAYINDEQFSKVKVISVFFVSLFFSFFWLPIRSLTPVLAEFVQKYDPYTGKMPDYIFGEYVYFLFQGPWVVPCIGLSIVVCVAIFIMIATDRIMVKMNVNAL